MSFYLLLLVDFFIVGKNETLDLSRRFGKEVDDLLVFFSYPITMVSFKIYHVLPKSSVRFWYVKKNEYLPTHTLGT